METHGTDWDIGTAALGGQKSLLKVTLELSSEGGESSGKNTQGPAQQMQRPEAPSCTHRSSEDTKMVLELSDPGRSPEQSGAKSKREAN